MCVLVRVCVCLPVCEGACCLVRECVTVRACMHTCVCVCVRVCVCVCVENNLYKQRKIIYNNEK